MITALTLSLAPLAAAPLPVQGRKPIRNDFDRIVLTGGKEVKGRVLWVDDEVVVVRSGGKREKEYERAKVAEIHSVEGSLNEFLDRVDAIEDPDDMAALAELATFCTENGLPGEARLVHLFMLTRDAENALAWEALGGREGKRGWELKDDKRWRSLDDFREHRSEWKNAMELETTHFWLRSDLPLERNIRILVTLEEMYRAYYETMTKNLRLYPFDERPEVHVTKNRKDYLKPPVEQDAWFAPATNTLFVCAEGEGADLPLVVGQFAQGMLLNSFRNTLKRDGQIAPWVTRGLGEWFAGAAVETPLRAKLDLERTSDALFRLHAEADEPLPISRILSMTYMELQSPGGELGSAQAYTLLYFLARGDDQRHREGLLEYVMGSYRGQSSVTHLEKALGGDLDAIEERWNAFVKEKAGS